MPLNNYYSSSVLPLDDKTLSLFRERINEWSNNIPHHPYHNFGDLVEVTEFVHHPVYISTMLIQVETRTAWPQVIPFIGQRVTGIPDLTRLFILQLHPDLPPFEQNAYKHHYFDKIYNCHDCNAKGYVTCEKCSGSGQIECRSCDAKGFHECNNCYGSGKMDCRICEWDGTIEKNCSNCNGTGEAYYDTRCNYCGGYGTVKIKCWNCRGKKKIECDRCDGRGSNGCDNCHRTGLVQCRNCDGSGSVTCRTCKGNKKMIEYTCINQAFSNQSLDRNTLPAIKDAFPELRLRKDHAKGEPVFSQEGKILPASLSFNNAEIESDYYELQQWVSGSITDNKTVKQQRFTIHELGTYQLICEYEGSRFDLWFFGNLHEIADGGSPIKSLRSNLIEESKNLYRIRQFYDSYSALKKAIEMTNIESIQKEKKVLLSIRRKLLLAYELGIISSSVLLIYLFPLLLGIFREILLRGLEKGQYSVISLNSTMIGASAVFAALGSLATIWIRHLWLKKSSSTAINSDIKRFCIGSAIPLVGSLVSILVVALILYFWRDTWLWMNISL